MVAPKGSLEIHEEAWNAYPYCKTVLSNPGYMKVIVMMIEYGHWSVINAILFLGTTINDSSLLRVKNLYMYT